MKRASNRLHLPKRAAGAGKRPLCPSAWRSNDSAVFRRAGYAQMRTAKQATATRRRTGSSRWRRERHPARRHGRDRQRVVASRAGARLLAEPRGAWPQRTRAPSTSTSLLAPARPARPHARSCIRRATGAVNHADPRHPPPANPQNYSPLPPNYLPAKPLSRRTHIGASADSRSRVSGVWTQPRRDHDPQTSGARSTPGPRRTSTSISAACCGSWRTWASWPTPTSC
jgi:hypothetical protein